MTNKLTLMGARHFIDMPKGTIYLRLWENNEKELLNIIENFKNDKLEIRWENVEIYGDNYGSMAFIHGEEDYIFYYDANVVGDADPALTLYLVISEELVPNIVPICNEYGELFNISRRDFFKARNKFLENFKDLPIDNKLDKENDWARQQLEEDDYYKDNYFVNFIMTK